MVVTQVYRIPHVPPPPGGPDDLGPSLLTAAGLGLLSVPLSLVMLNHVRDEDSGLASSLLSTGQQVGGAIGLAALGTVAWTVVASSAPAARRPGQG
jgi:hypothetical protein